MKKQEAEKILIKEKEAEAKVSSVSCTTVKARADLRDLGGSYTHQILPFPPLPYLWELPLKNPGTALIKA